MFTVATGCNRSLTGRPPRWKVIWHRYLYFLFAIFIVAGFGVPTIWTRLAPQSGQRPLELGQLMRQGIATNTGRLRGRDAVVQMMILPVLILAWGIAIVAIVATV